MAAAGAPEAAADSATDASPQHFDWHLQSIVKLNDTVATLRTQHQEAYNLLYERYVLLDRELSAVRSTILTIQELCQANTDTHISARPSPQTLLLNCDVTVCTKSSLFGGVIKVGKEFTHEKCCARQNL
jgi:hypothetical protein